jgi:ketosteroid isomerase-like protein
MNPMKTLKPLLLILILLILLFQACNDKPTATDDEADKKAIMELLEKYVDACNNEDLELFLSAWTDDAVRMEDGFYAIQGKEKIREHFKVPFTMFDINITVYGEPHIDVYGDVANGFGNYVLALTALGTESTTYFDGKFLDVYKRQPDGSWLIYIDCVTSNPKVTKETMKPDPVEEDMADPVF